MAGTDGAAVHGADGREFGGGAAEEGFVSHVKFVTGEGQFFNGVAEVAAELHEGGAGDAADVAAEKQFSACFF